EMCSIQKMVDEIRIIFGQGMEDKHVQFKTRILQNNVFADPGHFRQILMNLIENSMQSVNDGGWIKIESASVENEVELIIEDNGHGIGEAIREKIFDPFFTTKEKGSGLGLAIVKKLVDENNGDITLVSEQNKGTRFVLRLPGGHYDKSPTERKG
ncbi:HAMP domain-containing histidine kinase, partial [bacterium]